MKKNPKKKQQKKQQKKDEIKPTPKVFTLGELDLTLKIDFKDEDLVDENNNNIKFEDLQKLKDLKFIENNQKIYDRFKVTSKNEILKLLLLGNKSSSKQCFIDYICTGYPNFTEEEKFFDSILKYVTEKNGLNLNENPLDKNASLSIKIEMSHKGKKSSIIVDSAPVDEHEDDMDIKGEGETKEVEEQNPEENDDDDDEYGDYEPNEMMKLGFIPKFKRKKTVLKKLKPNADKYELVYFNFEDLNKIPGNFKLEDMVELLEFYKKKKTKIFINFYKEEKAEEEGKKEEEKEKKENEKKEKKDKKDKNEPSEEMIQLNRFYYITDIYFFDKKQAVKDFDLHYQSFTNDDPKKTINSRSVYDYFIKGIATGTEIEVPCDKTGLFLDEFKNFCIINVTKSSDKGESKISINKSEFDPQPFPKINTHNIEEVQEYKSIIKQNKNSLYSLFLSEMVTSMGGSAPNCSSPEVILPSFLTGVDLVKRKVELVRNNIELPDEEQLYKVKRDPKVLAEHLEKLAKGQKEGNFKLDCTNLITSNKKEYVSLYDYHLKNYFSREKNRKELKDKGFINQQGFIKYDPVFRNVMGTNNKNKQKFSEKEKKNELLSTIKDINVQVRLQDKEIDAEKAALNKNPTTSKKIPFVEEKKKKKKHKKKKGDQEGSSNSGSSDEENKSGENSSGNNENSPGSNE